MASLTRPAPASSAEERLVHGLIALLEAGTTPWRRDWDASQADHHCNLISGRRYRGANPVLLTLALHQRGSTLPYWCGFGEARAHGLAPRRGCSAAYVLRPQVQGCPSTDPRRKREAAAEPASGAPAPEAAETATTAAALGRSWVRYRPVPVFNAADLVGDGLAALIATRRRQAAAAARPEPERLAGAEAVLGSWPVPVLHGGDQPCYLPGPDRILLPGREAFHSASAYYATWAHEVVHSTGHRSRLARDLSGGMGAAGDRGRAYAREELVAELGAVLLGDRLEIGSAMANHAAYLNGWINLLRESPRHLLQVLGEARRAADLIAMEHDADAAEPGSSAAAS